MLPTYPVMTPDRIISIVRACIQGVSASLPGRMTIHSTPPLLTHSWASLTRTSRVLTAFWGRASKYSVNMSE